MFIKTIKLFFLFIPLTLQANEYSFFKFDKDVPVIVKNFKLVGHNNQYQIASYYYKNPKSSKIFITLHGYLDNCGYNIHINKILWEKGHSIFCADLPGHGNSTGTRATIDSFQTYRLLMDEILKQIPNKYNEINFIAHSTGTVSYLLHRLNSKKTVFNKVILLSPLIRNIHWYIAKTGHFFLRYFKDSVPRRSKEDPKYNPFNQIAKKDPFYIDYISLDWFARLKEWNENIAKNIIKIEDKIHILFAEEDEVIDVDFNMMFYAKTFPNAKIYKIEKSHHHIDYGIKEVEEQFLFTLNKILE